MRAAGRSRWSSTRPHSARWSAALARKAQVTARAGPMRPNTRGARKASAIVGTTRAITIWARMWTWNVEKNSVSRVVLPPTWCAIIDSEAAPAAQADLSPSNHRFLAAMFRLTRARSRRRPRATRRPCRGLRRRRTLPAIRPGAVRWSLGGESNRGVEQTRQELEPFTRGPEFELRGAAHDHPDRVAPAASFDTQRLDELVVAPVGPLGDAEHRRQPAERPSPGLLQRAIGTAAPARSLLAVVEREQGNELGVLGGQAPQRHVLDHEIGVFGVAVVSDDGSDVV